MMYPTFLVNKPPDLRPQPGAVGMDAHSGTDPFIMKPDGKGWLYRAQGTEGWAAAHAL